MAPMMTPACMSMARYMRASSEAMSARTAVMSVWVATPLASCSAAAAYARSDLFARRRKLMNEWAAYLEDGHAQALPL